MSSTAVALPRLPRTRATGRPGQQADLRRADRGVQRHGGVAHGDVLPGVPHVGARLELGVHADVRGTGVRPHRRDDDVGAAGQHRPGGDLVRQTGTDGRGLGGAGLALPHHREPDRVLQGGADGVG